MSRRPSPSTALASIVLVLAAGSLGGRDALAKDPKGKSKPAAKTGVFQLEASSPIEYILMSVPASYDPKKWYPLAFILHPQTDHPADSKPEPFVEAWGPTLDKRGWIVAAPKSVLWDNESSIEPIMDSLRRVTEAYRIDDRRVVMIGHGAGALMGWRMVTRNPDEFAAVMAFSGEIPQDDRSQLKGLAGKRAYLFRGSDERAYSAGAFAADKKYLELAKVEVTQFEKKGWNEAMPTPDIAKLADWLDDVYPPGGWRAKEAAAEKAIKEKDFAAASKAMAEIVAELRKMPYPAFRTRAEELQASMLDAGRVLIEDAKKLVDADALAAIAKMDETVKALKGIKGLEEEAKKAQAALLRLPAVVAALGKKKAEADGASYMEKAAAAEAKGDLVKALDAYRKAAAIDWSKKADAATKVSEIEPKVGGK
jgi:dienelactone hydrolase